MKNAYKVKVTVDGKLVESIPCVSKKAAIGVVKTILFNGLNVYGKHKSFSLSVLKMTGGKK